MDMARIPYIAHKKVLFDALRRKKRLKYALVASNLLWFGVVTFLLMR
jgi:hypothetical protein